LERLDVAVPDDASALDLDRERWLAEEAMDTDALDTDALDSELLRAEPRVVEAPDARRSTWVQPRGARRRRLTITAAVVLVSMVVVAISGAVGAWIVGRQAAPTQAALASSDRPPGQIGGLLPPVAVLQNGESGVLAQSLRPAVIALVPASCSDGAELVTQLAPQVGSFGVPLVAVGAAGQADQLDQLSAAAGTSRLVTLIDSEQRLRDVYGMAGTTLLLVRADGVVADVVDNAAPGIHLESDLVDLVPGVGSGT
jgi:hypothetical protein